MRRLGRAVVAAVATIAACGAGVLPAAAAEGPDTVTAFVAPGSSTRDGYYVLEAEPGARVTQTIVVRNDRTRPLEAHVEAVDAHTSDVTGVGYGAPGSTPTGVGAWIVVHTPVVVLQPGEQRSVDFTVHVPGDLAPGQYLAGISASVPLATTATTVADPAGGSAFSVTLQGQRLVAVQVSVPGPAAPELAVTGARATATPEGVALLVGIENRGNAFARGSGSVRVESTGLDHRFDVDTFVPGTAIEYRVPWTPNVEAGTHRIRVDLRYGDGRQVSWNGEIPIEGRLRARLESDLARVRIPGAGTLPLPLLVGLGLVVTALCGAGATVLRRRRGPAAVLPATVN